MANLLHKSSNIWKRKLFGTFPCLDRSEDIDTQELADKKMEQALDDDDEDGVRLALSQGASLNTRGKISGMTPLIFAIGHNFDSQSSIVRSMIIESKGGNTGNIDIRDNSGRTALYYAVQRGDEDIVRVLLGHGAQIDADLLHALPDNGTDTTLAIARLLIQAGARLDARDESGKTPLIAVCAKSMFFGEKDVDLVRLYLTHGASPTEKDNSGQTALSRAVRPRYMPCSPFASTAARKWQTEIVKLLLLEVEAHGGMSVLNERDDTGRTPLMHAVDAGVVAFYDPLERGVECQCGVVSLLLDSGADIDARDEGGQTALWVAVLMDSPRLAVVKLLLDRGADPSVEDCQGRSLLSQAIVRHGRDDAPVIKLLLEYSSRQIEKVVN